MCCSLLQAFGSFALAQKPLLNVFFFVPYHSRLFIEAPALENRIKLPLFFSLTWKVWLPHHKVECRFYPFLLLPVFYLTWLLGFDFVNVGLMCQAFSYFYYASARKG